MTSWTVDGAFPWIRWCNSSFSTDKYSWLIEMVIGFFFSNSRLHRIEDEWFKLGLLLQRRLHSNKNINAIHLATRHVLTVTFFFLQIFFSLFGSVPVWNCSSQQRVGDQHMPWSESADLASVYLSRWCLEERWIREQRSCGHQKNRGAFFLCLSMYSLTLRTQLHLSLSLFPFLSLCCSSVCHVCFLGAALVRVSLGHAAVGYMGFMSRLCIQESNASAVTWSSYVLPRWAPHQRPLLLEWKR